MDVVVLAKHVPNPSGDPPEIGPEFRLRRAEADGGLDPSDEPGVEIGILLARRHGGTVRVVSVGPGAAARALVRALALGADEATLVSDARLEGADALVTAKVLAAAVARRPFDLVIAGVESTDGATGTMPVTLAELLGVPSLTFARGLSLDAPRLSAERQTAEGYDLVECELPALVTVTAGAAEPRHPSLRDSIEAKKKPIERLSLADLGLDAGDLVPTQLVTSVEIAPERAGGELVDDEAEAVRRILELVEEAAAV